MTKHSDRTVIHIIGELREQVKILEIKTEDKNAEIYDISQKNSNFVETLVSQDIVIKNLEERLTQEQPQENDNGPTQDSH